MGDGWALSTAARQWCCDEAIKERVSFNWVLYTSMIWKSHIA